MEKNATTEDMKTLASCLNKLTLDGYTGNFKVTEKGLFSIEKEKYYKPEETHIINFFRFEGASDPADNSILYALELNDGTKGTLTDAYGPYADAEVEKYIKQVEDISKKQQKKIRNGSHEKSNRLLDSRFSFLPLLHNLKAICFYTPLPGDRPKNIVIINSTRKIKNKIFAIDAAPDAIPPNPNTAATIAMIKKIIVQRNIIDNLLRLNKERKTHAAKNKAKPSYKKR